MHSNSTRLKFRCELTQDFCKRFHKTILDEFYRAAFRLKFYTTLDKLQTYLDEPIRYYNNDRTHQVKMFCGRTSAQTMIKRKGAYYERVNALI